MILKRGLMQIVLAALLLAAQHGALTHQLRHWQDRLPAQLQQQDDKQKAAHSGLCDFHVSFAQILGAVNVRKRRCAWRPTPSSVTAIIFLRHFPPTSSFPPRAARPILL